MSKVDVTNGKRISFQFEASQYNKGWNELFSTNQHTFISGPTGNPKFMQIFMDTIFEITPKGIKPYITLQSKKLVTKEYLETLIAENDMSKSARVSKICNRLMKTDKIYNVFDYWETAKYIHFGYHFGFYVYSILYKKEENKAYVMSGITDDLLYTDKAGTLLIPNLYSFDENGYFYTRLQNPTNDAVAAKIAALEGGVAGMLTSSGQAANFYAIFNICQAGDHFVCSSAIYGGTFNLFGVTMKKLGIEVTFVSPDASEEEISAAFRPNTKALFGETISNPSLEVLDIEKFARIAHSHGVPLIVDNTFPTPINCRPFEWGADIVVHSTTKYMDGHATSVGGCIVDSGKFDWDAHADKFPGLCTPDESYHGLTYTKAFGKMAYITKATAQLMRDLGSIQSPQNSFLQYVTERSTDIT